MRLTQPKAIARAVEFHVHIRRRPVRLGSARERDLGTVLGGMADYSRILSESAADSRLFERDGVVGAILPDVPADPLLNSAVYRHATALAGVLPALGSAYREAGVEIWTVFVPATDRAARAVLGRAGYRLQSAPTAMAMDPLHVERPPLSDWTAAGDPAALAGICDRVFNAGETHARVFAGNPPERARFYVAARAGEPVSGILTGERDGNCAVNLAATLRDARSQGIGGALLRNALADAAERGCTTATVVSARASRPFYERLGFRTVCALQKWVARVNP